VHLAEQSAKRALQLSTLDQARALLGITEIAQGHWTPYARRLLEEAKTSIPDIDRVLEAWPESHSKEPKRLTINLGVR
jgi:hypothetical protein